MGKKVKMPDYAQPDPFEIMEAEVEYNRYDTANPYGITEWRRDPSTRKFYQTVTLNPEYEDIRRQQIARQNQGLVKNPFSALNEAAPGVGRIMSGAMQRVGERYDASPGVKPPTYQPVAPAELPAGPSPSDGANNAPGAVADPNPNNPGHGFLTPNPGARFLSPRR